jgi:DNA-binding NarL/FixJ family response regulator
MGLLRELLLVPMAPVRVASWTVDQVVDAASREFYGPEAVRRELTALSRQLDDGSITPEEFDRREDELLDRLAEGQRREETW